MMKHQTGKRHGVLLAVFLLIMVAVLVGLAGSSGQSASFEADMQQQEDSNEVGSTGTESSDQSSGQKESTDSDSGQKGSENQDSGQKEKDRKLYVKVNGKTFVATFAENDAVDAFHDHLTNGALKLKLSDYSGFEKVGSLGFSLPTSDTSMTSQSGDILLYNGSQIVIFYGSNSWSYTKLARVDDLDGWEDALGSGDVSITLSLAE